MVGLDWPTLGYLPTYLPYLAILDFAAGCSRTWRIPASWKDSYSDGFLEHIAHHMNSIPTCRVYKLSFQPHKRKLITHFQWF